MELLVQRGEEREQVVFSHEDRGMLRKLIPSPADRHLACGGSACPPLGLPLSRLCKGSGVRRLEHLQKALATFFNEIPEQFQSAGSLISGI